MGPSVFLHIITPLSFIRVVWMNTKYILGVPGSVSAEKPGMERNRPWGRTRPWDCNSKKLVRTHTELVTAAVVGVGYRWGQGNMKWCTRNIQYKHWLLVTLYLFIVHFVLRKVEGCLYTYCLKPGQEIIATAVWGVDYRLYQKSGGGHALSNLGQIGLMVATVIFSQERKSPHPLQL